MKPQVQGQGPPSTKMGIVPAISDPDLLAGQSSPQYKESPLESD